VFPVGLLASSNFNVMNLEDVLLRIEMVHITRS